MAATAISPRGDDQIKLTGGPVVFALRFMTGKDVQSKFPGGRVMFTAVDERKLFLNDEEANEFEHALLDLGIQPAEFIRVTRVTHGRGGGFSIRVERVEDDPDPAPAPTRRHGPARAEAPSRIEAQLEASIPLARQHGAAAFHEKKRAAAPEEETTARKDRYNTSTSGQPESTPAAPASAKGSMSALLAGALCASIDAYAIATEYATTRGCPVAFTSEDLRSSANTFLIQYWRDGGTR